MDCLWEILLAIYGLLALTIFLCAYIIEVKLDLPSIGDENYQIGLAHGKIKSFVEKIVHDTLNLSAFFHNGSTKDQPTPEEPPSMLLDSQKYQQILTTAIVNKIMDSYGNEKQLNSQNDAFPDINSSNLTGVDKNQNTISKDKTHYRDYSSSSSFEPHSDSSLGEVISLSKADDITFESYTNPLSETFSHNINNNEGDSTRSDHFIKRRPEKSIHDLSTDTESLNDDFTSAATSLRHEAVWDENWSFRKKTSMPSSTQPTGMLVPAPKEIVKALIGDKSADEISDLSEAGSDIELDDNNAQDDTNECLNEPNERIFNRHVIGGKSTVGIFDELIEQTSLVSTSSLQENEPAYTETKNDFVFNNNNLNANNNNKITDNLHKEIPLENEAVNYKVLRETKRQKCSSHEAKENNETISIQNVNVPLTSTEDLMGTSGIDSFNGSSKGDSLDVELTPESTETQTDINETNIDSSVSREQILNQENPSFSESTNEKCCSDNLQLNTVIEKNEDQVEKNCTNSTEDIEKEPFKHLTPGSIAEREYKKWYNAVEMPNNPYSPEALKRRLSSGSEKPIDIPNINTSIDKPSVEPFQTDPDLEAKEDYKSRYSRDYYINESKQASGGTLKDNLTQESSKNKVADKVIEPGIHDKEVFDKPAKEDLFTARPIHIIGKDENLVQENSFITYNVDNSTVSPVKEFHKIIPISEEESEQQESINSPKREVTSPINYSQYTNNTDSLPTSEDSDTIRIYNINKQETKIIKNNTIDEENNRKYPRPKSLHLPFTTQSSSPQLTPSLSEKFLVTTGKLVDSPTGIVTTPTKAGTPTSLKFLQPKRKLLDIRQIMGDSAAADTSSSSGGKDVIEKEVASSLPSVKALAQAYLLASSKGHSVTASRPKKKWRKSVNEITEEIKRETLARNGVNGESSSDSYQPPYNNNYFPAEESSDNENREVHENENNIADRIGSDAMDEKDIEFLERVISPAPKRGLLKDNIAFFENLQKK